jgi:hypothetical protein
MARFDSFTGPFNTPFSPNIQSEFTMNWLPEKVSVSVEGQGTDVHDKNVRCSLIRLPGLGLFVTLPQSPVRGLFPGEFRLFAVGGAHLYEVLDGGTIIDRSTPGFSGASGVGPQGSTIGNDGRPVQMFVNGNQLAIISAGYAYVDNGNGPVQAQYSDPLTDLVINSTDTTLLNTSTGNFFDQSDVGRTIQILSGAGFTVGSGQLIISVDANGNAKQAGSWGLPGSSLGTGIEWIGHFTFTDLALGTIPTMVSSASHMFGPSDIGLPMTISGPTGWTAGTYTITGLVVNSSGVPTGAAILDRAAGTSGAINGTGTTPSSLVTASQGAFLDGYFFIVPNPPTKVVFYSGAPDGTSDGTMWDPLNFFSKAAYPDNVNVLFADHEELYTCGDLESTQVWRDVGDANNPFAPDPGGFMHVGCQAPLSFVRLGNGVAWIGQDMRRGTRKAVQAVGYQPNVISTPAVESVWAHYQTADAVAFTWADVGHELWVITFPSDNATWFYDNTTGFWGQWGHSSGGVWNRILPWVHCVVAFPSSTDVHYAGDYSSGNIYIMSRDYKTDNGAEIVRRRTAPHLTNENMRRFYARFEIDCDVDGLQRIFWNRLGNGRDRIWQLDSSQASETGGVTLTLGFSDDRMQSFQTVFSQTLDPSVDVSLANAYLNWTDATWH